MADLYHFAASSVGMSIKDRLKLTLFAAGVKPNAFVILKTGPQTLEERFLLESALRQSNVLFDRGRDKSYEEIVEVKYNFVKWRLAGTWNGYDLFANKKDRQDFRKYIHLLTQGKLVQADGLAGKVYGYPACCIVQYSKERDPVLIKKKYSCFEFYKKAHDLGRAFPWVFHQPHSLDCAPTKRLNALYEKTVKEKNHKLWGEYTKSRSVSASLIVAGESDILLHNKTIWPNKDGHEYEVVTREPVEGHYYLLPLLTKQSHPLGAVLDVKLTFKFNYVDLAITKVHERGVGEVVHLRKLPLLGRNF